MVRTLKKRTEGIAVKILDSGPPLMETSLFVSSSRKRSIGAYMVTLLSIGVLQVLWLTRICRNKKVQKHIDGNYTVATKEDPSSLWVVEWVLERSSRWKDSMQV